MNQSPMIYAQMPIARMIAAKMTKSKGVKHDVVKVPTGWEVIAPFVEAVKALMPGDSFSPFVGGKPPTDVAVKKYLAKMNEGAVLPALMELPVLDHGFKLAITEGKLVAFDAYYVRESKGFVTVKGPNGKDALIGRSQLKGFHMIDATPGKCRVAMTATYAKSRGFLADTTNHDSELAGIKSVGHLV